MNEARFREIWKTAYERACKYGIALVQGDTLIKDFRVENTEETESAKPADKTAKLE